MVRGSDHLFQCQNQIFRFLSRSYSFVFSVMHINAMVKGRVWVIYVTGSCICFNLLFWTRDSEFTYFGEISFLFFFLKENEESFHVEFTIEVTQHRSLDCVGDSTVVFQHGTLSLLPDTLPRSDRRGRQRARGVRLEENPVIYLAGTLDYSSFYSLKNKTEREMREGDC